MPIDSMRTDAVKDYAYLWDGSQAGWVLLKINQQALKVTIRVAAGGPTLRDVAATRAALPAYAALPPSEAFAALKGRPLVPLGTFDSEEGRRLAEKCRQHGLTVETEGEDRSRNLLVNEQGSHALVIEDDELAALVCQEALSQGIQVRHVEA
jgi:hypothetical protein